jgi:plasmid stabilization system protein ParE
MRLEWSAVALADLDRFAAFLHERHPRLAPIVAREILAKAQVLEASHELGRASAMMAATAGSCSKSCAPNMSSATGSQASGS